MEKEKINYRYFLYSDSQYRMRREIEATINKKFIPGKVLYKGKWKNFTEISSSPDNGFSDCKVVAEGYLGDMQYQDFRSEWGA